jgi:signal transduction histidine kinase/HAMP domain-containing protein
VFSLRGKLLLYALEIIASVILLLSIPPQETSTRIGLAALSVFAIVLAFSLGRSITRRLERLAESARGIGAGRYDEPVTLEGRDEIGVVAAEMDRMRRKLRAEGERQQALNVELERKVEERTRLLREANQRLAVMNEVTAAIGSTLDFQTIFEAVVSGAHRLVEFDQASVARVVDPETAVVFASAGGLASIRRGEAFALGGSRVGEVLRTRTPAVYDLSLPPIVEDTLLMSSIVREAILPLVAGDQPIGTLNFGSARKDAFQPTDLETLGQIAREVAVALLQADAFDRERCAGEELKRLSALKSEFVSKVSHELRTPLTSILGAADNLLDGIAGALDEKPQAYLRRIRENSVRLLGLINELLDSARIESGREQLAIGALDLGALIEETLETLRPVASTRGISLGWAGSAPVGLLADRDKIARVLLNLLHNAIRFTDTGGRVDVHVLASAASIRIEVHDTGVGIPPEELERIFDKFHQVKPPGNRAASGTGLGLAISRQLVELHGGSLTATSTPGRGSVFTVILPAPLTATAAAS